MKRYCPVASAMALPALLPFAALVLAGIIDIPLHGAGNFTASAVVTGVLGVIALIATLQNLGNYGGVMKIICLAVCGFMLVSAFANLNGAEEQDSGIPATAGGSYNTGYSGGYTGGYSGDTSGSTSSKSSGYVYCNFCGASGDCTTCGGDGKVEALSGSIWGTMCRTCEGSGNCGYCGGDGDRGN